MGDEFASRTDGDLSIPGWRLRKAMLDADFSGGARGLFLRYRDRVHVGEVELRTTPRGLELDVITTVSRHRSKGVGTAMLRDVCRVADQLGVSIRLTAVPVGDGGPSFEGLVNWYRHAGFKPIGPMDFGLRMGRRPRVPVQAPRETVSKQDGVVMEMSDDPAP